MLVIDVVLIIVLGASLGSFLNVVIDRLPRKASLVRPGSHCNSCGKKIPFWLNIPIISYLALKGKCKYCGARFHWHHLLVEIITPLMFLALYAVYGLSPMFFKFATMVSFLIPIFFIDAYHKIIPLALTLPLIASGWLWALVPETFVSFPDSLLASVLTFAFLYLLALAWEKIFRKEGLGGGDVVLFPGVAAYFGLLNIPFIVILACLMGIIYFLAFVRKNTPFAFGNFIAAAAVIWALAGEWILSLAGLPAFVSLFSN
ncbi:MAG TPA: prepilin peptidase [Candidatus Cloacimonadota bacterium]|nr:prepilin peptidase [Candidatus Cloacimonadota bacterium]HOF59368.1 prepilin peptidase [Candidatus Cloacimonadota bacterium]HOR58518.1 prepilin peptidase [Candidatus Cloacimonadota bacterium]HQL13015.1 prepilin peptidase [Candidatus Cloacimonadota bacterium]HQO44053.1 prepilin peptidase [Candidatus Cloacimonadota bacterium]